MSAIVAMLIVIDPFGLASRWPRRIEVAGAVLGAAGAAVLLADHALRVLDLSEEGFWIAAGVLLLVPAFARLKRSTNHDLAGPAPIAAAIAIATRDGTGSALLGVAFVALATAILSRFDAPKRARVIQNLVGGAMVVVAFDLIRDGVIAV